MTRYYLDTSIAVHALLGSRRAEEWFDAVTADPADTLVSSRILRAELTRGCGGRTYPSPNGTPFSTTSR